MRQKLVASVFICLLAWPVAAVLESGVYQVAPGATVRERGDWVTNGTRIVPLSATMKFDLSAVPPSLTAVITNAVLEGGDPFSLTVRSSHSYQLANGTYRFSGDYLRDIKPSGTQYLFEWSFSSSTNGQVIWNGYTTWAGGHLWDITISNLVLLPQPWLTISRTGGASVQITWSTNFPDHSLEHATNLPSTAWSGLTNPVSSVGGRLSITVEIGGQNRFYRLRKP